MKADFGFGWRATLSRHLDRPVSGRGSVKQFGNACHPQLFANGSTRACSCWACFWLCARLSDHAKRRLHDANVCPGSSTTKPRTPNCGLNISSALEADQLPIRRWWNVRADLPNCKTSEGTRLVARAMAAHKILAGGTAPTAAPARARPRPAMTLPVAARSTAKRAFR